MRKLPVSENADRIEKLGVGSRTLKTLNIGWRLILFPIFPSGYFKRLTRSERTRQSGKERKIGKRIEIEHRLGLGRAVLIWKGLISTLEGLIRKSARLAIRPKRAVKS